ncbi:hypothetical protein [Tuwongella immobilis]|nr:hypothetical protein [Tuwongella immobilis]
MTSIESLLMEHCRKHDDSNEEARETAAAQLGDCSEYLMIRQKAVEGTVFCAVVETMQKRAIVEQNVEIQVTILSAMVDAASLSPCRNIDWSSLAQSLPSLDQRLIEYALQILAFTHDLQYEAVLQHYRNSSDPLLRQIANDALVELHGIPLKSTQESLPNV